MTYQRIYSVVLGLCLGFGATVAHAQVMPDDFFYLFEANSPPVVNVQVQNLYKDKSVDVETESIQVVNPGDKPEKTDKVDAIIVSPKKFTLQPEEKRVLRLLLKKRPSGVEDVYRVILRPTSHKDIVSKDKKAPADQKSINLAVLVGSGVLIFAHPMGVKREISWSRVGKEYIIKNTGNVNLMLTACPVSHTSCEKSGDGGRIYAGKTLKFKLTDNAIKVQRDLFTGEKEFFTIDQPTGARKFEN